MPPPRPLLSDISSKLHSAPGTQEDHSLPLLSPPTLVAPPWGEILKEMLWNGHTSSTIGIKKKKNSIGDQSNKYVLYL